MDKRIELVKALKKKYEGKNLLQKTITKVKEENNLSNRELTYIFFEDYFLTTYVIGK